MINKQHLIVPSEELVQQWISQWVGGDTTLAFYIATQAARWGWDQRGAANEAELQKARDEELEACYEWLYFYGANGAFSAGDARNLRAARRPQPPSLKEQALESLTKIEDNKATYLDSSIIRRALEALPND